MSTPNALPADLSPWQMFLHADAVVQAIMLALIAAALLCWTVLLAKSWELRGCTRRLRAERDRLSTATDLEGAALPATGAVQALIEAARDELVLSAGLPDKAAIRERVASRMERIELMQARQLRVGTGVLATIGATAPFVGLFGTVWGIMNSFIGIARSNTTNLAVVAPGIAEALLATALGLVAAIPAVVIYNHFARRLQVLRAELGDASAVVQQLLSRDLDRQHLALERR